MSVFGKCDLLLPYFAAEDERWNIWSVIACDQHTSDPSYWERAERAASRGASTLGLILPEAYLGTDRETAAKERIKKYPEKISGILKEYKDALVYVERTLSSGDVRRGLVGAVDLDCYDYKKGSTPAVRPTEGTVVERIPPRLAVRRDSTYEASHVMLFTEGAELFDMLTSSKDSMHTLYDFDLAEGGGHVTGRLVSGDILVRAEEMISSYETERAEAGKIVYSVGDGNHSLASAKAYLEELREAGADPRGASHALVELIPITDRAIVFEPIYKHVTDVEQDDLIRFVKEATAGDGASVTAVTPEGEQTFTVKKTDDSVVCGTLQEAIDRYTAKRGGKCDYIHGKDELLSLARESGVGFLFDGIDKSELFPYVEANGVLPRKAFSMGEACEKRYYTELRRLK